MSEYKVSEMFFGDCVTHRNVEWGDIVVGGDRGDVYIESASDDGDGVRCTNLVLSTLDEDLTDEEVEEYITEIVEFCYESIGGDTFIGQTRW